MAGNGEKEINYDHMSLILPIYFLLKFCPILYISEVLPPCSPILLFCLNGTAICSMAANGGTCEHARHSASVIVTHCTQETSAGSVEEAERSEWSHASPSVAIL